MTQTAATREPNLKAYIFPVELEQEEDGRWSAVVQSLPGCATLDIANRKHSRRIRKPLKRMFRLFWSKGNRFLGRQTLK